MNVGYMIKRAIDYAVAGGTLAIAAPAMGLIAAAIKLDSPGPVLFRQTRIGRDGREFDLLKFRTMRDAPIRYHSDGSTRIDANDDRVTRVGRYLRGALDELPQLVNILRGEMSLVGPRPEMATQRSMYAPEHLAKLKALPGLTSLAIVHGRNDIPWSQRVAIDIMYVERWSLALDLKIIAQTLLMPLGKRVFRFDEVLEA